MTRLDFILSVLIMIQSSLYVTLDTCLYETMDIVQRQMEYATDHDERTVHVRLLMLTQIAIFITLFMFLLSISFAVLSMKKRGKRVRTAIRV